MRVVLLADVGGADGYHAGDEAMLDAAIDALRQRGAVDITVISSDPIDTATRYGVSAVAPIGFPSDGAQAEALRDQQLAAVLEHNASTSSGGAPAVVDAIRSADALIVTGGGNLSSSWPQHIYERVAALTVARAANVPAVVTSQTIGPDLTVHETALLAAALDGAHLVGLRERASLGLTSTLIAASTPRRLQLDDAAFLPDETVASFAGDELLGDGFIGLTANPIGLGPKADARLDGLAALVRRLHARTRLPVVFLPHVGSWSGEPFGDVAVGEALRRRIGDGREFIVAPLLPARQLASLTRRATAIISTRYHPLVFGLAASVPCLAIYQDRYTEAKLTGALGHAGLAGWRLPIDALATDLPGDVIDELWSRREELTEHLSFVTADWPSIQQAHWDEVWTAITDSETSLRPERATFAALDEVVPKLAGLAEINAIAAEHAGTLAALDAAWRAAFLQAERYALSLEHAVADKTAELVDLHNRRAEIEADNIQLLDELRHAEQAAATARALVGSLRERLDTELADAVARADFLQYHVDLLFATKTMRLVRWPRELYRRARLRRLKD